MEKIYLAVVALRYYCSVCVFLKGTQNRFLKRLVFGLLSTNITEYVFKLNIKEINRGTWLKHACTCLLLSFREMASVFRAKHMHSTACKIEAKTKMFPTAVSPRKVQLHFLSCQEKIFFHCGS